MDKKDDKDKMNLLAYTPRLTVTEAACVTGISPRTLQDNINKGKIKHFISFGRVYISVEVVQQLIKNNKKS